MFGIGTRHDTRFAHVLSGLLLAGLLGGLFARSERDHERETAERARAQAETALFSCRMTHAPQTADQARELAFAAYRDGDFARAAEIVAAFRPSDVDLQNLALQYEKLATAWAFSMDPWN